METEDTQAEIRDERWLAERVGLLWEMHFSDVPKGFPIVARFGTRAKYRFGSIAARNDKTVILVNQLFSDPFVPVFVVDGTLVHELAHYVHGFGSGLPRRHRHAHRGGVVDQELEARGLIELDRKANTWREANWDAFYAEKCGDLLQRETARKDATSSIWKALLSRPGSRTEEELRQRLVTLAPRFGYSEATLPFRVEWLHATRRQNGISYWFARSRAVRLHGLASDRRVPDVVIDFEIAYWLARQTVGSGWEGIHRLLSRGGMQAASDDALRWRRHAWTSFCNRHHPLGPIVEPASSANRSRSRKNSR